ncbi:hypothetical protein [Actinoplanes sp. DH11]|uniref:hypothetical protein n=1 Tax=Actinoplanes sp. DH11 TaxID=2857011 RepID=UPI001E57A550|nr:hypothetical protein [Actinoplanes sp. DH11]
MQADQDGTMMLGLHGTLRFAPWLHGIELEDDAFSLVEKRSGAYGLLSAPGQRWHHHEAGGDWTPDGEVRERCWLQVGVPGDRGKQRLPVLPGVRVLTDVVTRLGAFGFTGLHAVLPMHLTEDIGIDLADAADWFALANRSAVADLVVSVSADMSLDLPGRAAALAAAAEERGNGLLKVRPTGPGQARPGLAAECTGEGFLPADWNREQEFWCQASEWSPDLAAWVIEVFLDALRETAPTEGMALLTVSARA